MIQKGCYLVCHEHINEVEKFLKQFYKLKGNKYNHKGWITFQTSKDFIVNLMTGKSLPLTQHFSFEIYCKNKKQLEKYSKIYKQRIKGFIATESKQKYRYSYITLKSPKDICRMEISYSEDM